MAEEGQDGSSCDDPAALGLSLAGASRERADEYLRKQSRLADLQIDTLEKKDEFELSHLRFRRFSDYARFALEISAGLVVLLIICGLATMVWSASRDHDLVVDAFSVPPDIAQTGLTGAALSNRILDRVGAMDHSSTSFAQDFSAYHADAAKDVRVEIPDTGVSIGELNRYLQGWLGHETHVSGELVRTPSGLSLTVRYGDQPGMTLDGADLKSLVEKSAEAVFRAGQPLRYADYLSSHSRTAQGRAIAEAETRTGDNAHRAQAYVSLGVNDYWTGDSRAMAADGGMAVRLDPDNGLAWYILEAFSNNLDHEEENFRVTQTMLRLAKEGKLTSQNADVARLMPAEFQSILDLLKGDFQGAIENCKADMTGRLGNCAAVSLSSIYGSAHDLAGARFLLTQSPARRSNGTVNADLIFAKVQVDLLAGDYANAVNASKQGEQASSSPALSLDRDVFLRPFEAEAMARTGDIAGGRKIAAATPDDCDTCQRARGRVEMLARNWSAAAHWFAIVSKRTPSIPLADSDWGMMLMAKGDLNGAIAKFDSANQKGPHFADPLEMWGEALIAKNRSDLALAKFAEAEKYAPKWGRLHLKWGEALLWSGDKNGAAKQFAAARSLYLTSPETRECAKLCDKS
jgi:tetratricopeptide (TPR) repeat protein